MLQMVEDRFIAVRKKLSTESRARYEEIEQVKGTLENDLPQLQELIQIEVDARGGANSGLFT